MHTKQFVILFSAVLLLIISACSSSKKTTKEEIQYSYTEHNIKYLDLNTGTGRTPKIGDKVTIYTKVVTEDGTVLEDTFSSKQPITFVLYDIENEKLEVIKGLAEGIMTMKKGGKRKLWVPPDMGFGSRRHSSIPGNSTLVITVELLDVK
jgi:peptidylprolyl isomerase